MLSGLSQLMLLAIDLGSAPVPFPASVDPMTSLYSCLFQTSPLFLPFTLSPSAFCSYVAEYESSLL